MSMTAGLIRVGDEELKSIINGEVSLNGYLFPEDVVAHENICEVYKAWNGIMFLLEKLAIDDNSVLHRAVLGGTPFGEDMGYGPPMFVAVDEVAEINKRLTEIDEAGLRGAFDAAEMEEAGIYCFSVENAEEDLEFYIEHYTQMRAFYAAAAKEKQAVIQFLV